MPDYQPTIPPQVRDAAYIGGLGVAFIVTLGVGIVSIWIPDYRAQAAETGVVINSAVALLVAGLGTAYRPGAQIR